MLQLYINAPQKSELTTISPGRGKLQEKYVKDSVSKNNSLAMAFQFSKELTSIKLVACIVTKNINIYL